MSPGKIALSIIGIVIVIVGAYYGTYFLASRGNSRFRSGRLITVLDSFSFSKDKVILLVEAAGQIYLLAMSGGAVALIDKLDKEVLEAAREKHGGVDDGAVARGLADSVSAIKNMGLLNRTKKNQTGETADFQDFIDLGSKDAGTQAKDAGLDSIYQKMQSLKARSRWDNPFNGGAEQ